MNARWLVGLGNGHAFEASPLLQRSPRSIYVKFDFRQNGGYLVLGFRQAGRQGRCDGSVKSIRRLAFRQMA